MPEPGEEIVGVWLRCCAACEFVDYNVSVRDEQGEIDVVGLNLSEKTVYLCEAATHTRGLDYPDLVEKLKGKYKRAHAYHHKYLNGWKPVFMFWSPVVRRGNQMNGLLEVQQSLNASPGLSLDLVINDAYAGNLQQLQAEALNQPANNAQFLVRFFQIVDAAKLDSLQLKGPAI